MLRKSQIPNPNVQSGIVGWAAVLLLVATASGLEFSVDWAAFRAAQPESTMVEFYHSVPYDQLHYRTFGDTIYAEYQVRLELRNLATGALTRESLWEPAVIPSFAEAERRRLSIGHSFSMNLAPGTWLMKFELQDSFGAGTRTETLEVRDLRRVPAISDPIIGGTVTEGPTGRMTVIPQPARTFGDSGRRELYVYVDGYDFGRPGADSVHYTVSAAIIDPAGQVVKSLPAEHRIGASSRVTEIFGLTTQGLKPGGYLLEVRLHDLATDSTAVSRKRFGVGGAADIASRPKPAADDTLRMSSEQKAAWRDLRYIATEQELKSLNRLSPAGQYEYLRKFWKRYDFATYLNRLQAVDARFGWGLRLGRATDRGRIYLRYGEPDELEVHTMIEHTNPHEHWRYYQSGYHFIFVDVRGDGYLRLVYSNCADERKDPKWQSLVDPLELEELQEN